ncbi:hypothetical protein [Ktedonospora formicarum]|uniref:Uncharacterized protein n=1 Tax=Ktedonospora formicarum TaxID=2778364 RepID=A0A8J3HYI5_9CHLR|nr:hypothetical protein [Ktedonospora formicarum]GHO44311.1 hypothetical protein KSX_24740 [Ktedonospora formicarum]
MNNSQPFNPREHLINIRNGKGTSEYLEVKWRLVWFRQECPEGTIETELVHLDIDKETEEEAFVWNAEKRRSEKVIKTAKGIAIFRAVVRDGKGGVATGTKMERAAAFPDYLEKAESGSIGRALAALGYGTQFAPELNEEHRIVDAPVERSNGAHINGNGNGNAAAAVANGARAEKGEALTPESAATERQVSSIRKLCQHLSKPEPSDLSSMTVLSAKHLIQQLTEEFKAQQQQNKAS